MSNVLKSLRFHDSTPEDSHGKSRKKKSEPPKKRDRSKSNYSLISLSEVTEGALQIWRSLPEKIRQDPSLASFRQENERIHGKYMQKVMNLVLRLVKKYTFEG